MCVPQQTREERTGGRQRQHKVHVTGEGRNGRTLHENKARKRRRRMKRVCPPQTIATCARRHWELECVPQQSHHKGREREQGKRGPGADRKGKGRGKQSGAGRAGEEQRRWAREEKKNTAAPRTQTPKSARRERNMTPRIGASGARGSTARAPGLDRPGVNPCHRLERSRQRGEYDKRTPRNGAAGAE